MNFLRGLATVLFVVPIGMFLYDAVKGWFVEAHVHFRSLQQWWSWLSPQTLGTGRLYLGKLLAPAQVDAVMNGPACVVMLAPPVALYILYRLWFALAGGKSGGGFTYKSRD